MVGFMDRNTALDAYYSREDRGRQQSAEDRTTQLDDERLAREAAVDAALRTGLRGVSSGGMAPPAVSPVPMGGSAPPPPAGGGLRGVTASAAPAPMASPAPTPPAPVSSGIGRWGTDRSGRSVAGTDAEMAWQATQAALNAAAAGYGNPLDDRVTSGYRSPEHNAAVGGAEHSQHMSGTAVDLSVAGMSDAEQARLFESLIDAGFNAFGQYGDGTIHADMRPQAMTWTDFTPAVAAVLAERGVVPGAPAETIRRNATGAPINPPYAQPAGGSGQAGGGGQVAANWQSNGSMDPMLSALTGVEGGGQLAYDYWRDQQGLGREDAQRAEGRAWDLQDDARDRQERMEELALQALAAGDLVTYRHWAAQAGVQIPEEILADVDQRSLLSEGALIAGEFYRDNPAQAQAFTQAYMANRGDMTAAFTAAGVPATRPNLTLREMIHEGERVLAIIDENSGAVQGYVSDPTTGQPLQAPAGGTGSQANTNREAGLNYRYWMEALEEDPNWSGRTHEERDAEARRLSGMAPAPPAPPGQQTGPAPQAAAPQSQTYMPSQLDAAGRVIDYLFGSDSTPQPPPMTDSTTGAAAPQPAAAPTPQAASGIPPEAIALLLSDPSPEAIAEFNAPYPNGFGPGAAERVLSAQPPTR